MGYLLLSAVSVMIILTSYHINNFLTISHDSREPPLIQPKVPHIGHVIGLLQYGTGYYTKIAKRCNKPIFTLGLPRARMYIVTSPILVAACDRRSKIVSFAPYVVDFARRILVASQHGIGLLSEDLPEDRGTETLRPETMKTMHQSLKPGEVLDDTSRAFLKNVLSFLDSAIDVGNQRSVPLFQWIQRFVSIASTNVIYGPEKNPMQDPEVLDGFWAVDRDFALLGLMVLLPELVARKGSRGRKRFFTAFRQYYATGGLKTASPLIKARYDVNTKHGVSNEDIAHFDLGVCTALLVNTVPAIYWTLCYVFSNEALLDELRQGIEAVIFKQGTVPKVSAITVNVPQVIEEFPLLESLVKEVLRVQSNSSSARFLLKDVLVKDGHGDTYLLKKDSFLAMPSALLHGDEVAWGPTAHKFDAARFLKQQDHKTPASAHRTFGGGNALCPGRHFAMHEIMTILIIMVLKYDIKPPEGEWKMPRTRHHISTSILTPVQDFLVRVQRREEIRGIRWNFVWKREARTPS